MFFVPAAWKTKRIPFGIFRTFHVLTAAKERMHKIIKNYQELFEKNAVKITKNNR